MTTLLHQFGLGDFLMMERFFTPEERASLRTIYWQTVAASLCIDLMRSCPTYAHVEHHIATASNLEACRAATPTAPFFTLAHQRPFTGSSILRRGKSIDLPLSPNGRFLLIHPSTPINLSGQRKIRDFEQADWDHVLWTLEARNIFGLVVNSKGAPPAPRHRLILDYQGHTTPAHSVQLLRRADGFMGIDSWLAILASEVFPADRLQIRTRNPWVIRDAQIVYAPHVDTPFLYPTLGADPHPQPERWGLPPGGQWMELLRETTLADHRTYFPGDVVPVPRDLIDKFLVEGRARPWHGEQAA